MYNPTNNLFPSGMPNYNQLINPSLSQMMDAGVAQYVNGRESALAFSTKPNQKYILMDSNEDVFYLVSTDASNFKTIKTYSFTEKAEDTTKADTAFVTKEEFEELKKTVEDFKPVLESLKE